MAYKNGNGKISIGGFSLLLKSFFNKREKGKRRQSESQSGLNPKSMKIRFFGGKGGVGKTTCSAIFACSLAEKGYRTLLVSTDPAHSLGDLLGVNAQTVHEAAPGLWVKEINSEEANENYIKEVKGNLEKLTAPEMWKEVERQIDLATNSPGADEAALFDELVKVILDAQGTYDQVVFDTAPTGHTLRLLSLPELMEAWMEGMLVQRRKSQDMNRMLSNIAGVREEEPVDRVFDILQRRKYRFTMAKEHLLNPLTTSFYFVLNPERLPIIETEKAINILEKHHIPIGGIVVNRILPEHADGQFIEKRREQEQIYLDEILEKFNRLDKVYIPMSTADIKGLEEIKGMTGLFSHFNNSEGTKENNP